MGANLKTMYKSKDNFLNEQEAAYNSKGRQQDINNLLYMEDKSMPHVRAANEYAGCVSNLMDTIRLCKKARPHERTLLLDNMWDTIKQTNENVSKIMGNTPEMSEAHALMLINALS